MPLYEYQCDACGHRFETIRKFSDEPLESCPKCGGAVRKLQAAPAIQFKGSGWYITDYAKKDSPPAGKSDQTDKADSGSKDPAGSNTASKTETPGQSKAKGETAVKPSASEKKGVG
jgi:putative FmdB family regulatory protein